MDNQAVIDGICLCIKKAMPELRTVERYAGQFQSGSEKRVSIPCPAVLVASLGKQPDASEQVDFGQVAVRARLVMFCIADDGKRQSRTVSAEDIADQLIQLGDGHNWSVDGLYDAQFERAENLFSPAFDKKGLGVWMVSFHQSYQLGDSQWPPGDIIEVEAMLHDAPEIGETDPAYRDEYDSLGRAPIRIEEGDVS